LRRHADRRLRPHTAANLRRYNRIAPLYDLFDLALEGRYHPGRALIGAKALGVTLEAGAGTGKNFQHYGWQARVFASDLSSGMLAQARRRLRSPVRALVAAEVAELPFQDAVADTVVATFVCCVQDDPAPSVWEMARVLKPGGRVLCMDYTIGAERKLRALMRFIELPLRMLYGVRWDHDVPGLLEAAGLRVTEVQPLWGPVVRYMVAEKPAVRGPVALVTA
jgi:ubiquinone/menaquinone biosynthesis C-methylase UbiE